jgi:Cu(I)/Ag(I) efflux system membrane fusion protein
MIMKKKQIVRSMARIAATVLLMAGLMLEGCHSKKGKAPVSATEYYTCPMHPQVHEDKPGNCPICGMKLIKVTASGGAEEPHEPLDTALIYLTEPVTRTVAGSFKVFTPVRTVSNDTIQADGAIGFDQRDINTVASLVSGRIVKLYVNYMNQTIRKGQPLMAIYSPELLSTQRDLLQAIHDRDPSLTRMLNEKLLNLGMRTTEIQKVMQSGQPMTDITLYSPYNGVARQVGSGSRSEESPPGGNNGMPGMGVANRGTSPTVKNVSFHAPENAQGWLNLREGMYVDKGQTLFAIQDIHSTWAILQVFAADLGHIHPGNPVTIYAAADTAHKVRGRVDFIPPYRNSDDKTTGIRVYVKSLPKNWKIGTLIHGQVAATGEAGGWNIPLSAVNLLGTRSVVWVKDPVHKGVFQAREVRTGLQTGDSIRVLSGIHPGDQLVENAAYMVDSDDFTK